MSIYPAKAPHQGAREPVSAAPNAALLIDFDNVTMGMRSDLSKELKDLLDSDIIKGKVAVQRAYADWRRYPQYIVPLSEASIDLIFAPAYGSNKKNATDIRMAIDGIELVFTRPEIGTFILLTGDSDFSSLVLKLKEYGKYVIGVGIQESSSDILVQNCDEYYSYTSLSGLRKTTDSDRQAIDPWVLVERAVEHMAAKDDVMRSDRLKQVMVDLDPGFDEKEYGFSKFSRFVTEASSRGLIHTRKLENGQYAVAPSDRVEARSTGEERGSGKEETRGSGQAEEERRPRSRREVRDQGRGRRERETGAAPVVDGPALRAAYDLLARALERMLADGRRAVRDSDVKRRMLELDESFDESALGFAKFSRFLRQAHDHDVIELHQRDDGNFEVSLHPVDGARPELAPPAPDAGRQAPQGRPESVLTALGRRLGLLPLRPEPSPPVPAPEPPPPHGQGAPAAATAPLASAPGPTEAHAEKPPLDLLALGLPTDADAQVRYLSNSYRGVGRKTAERLVEGLGEDLFRIFQEEPERVRNVIPRARAENVLEQWKTDFDRRVSRVEGEPAAGAPGGAQGSAGPTTDQPASAAGAAPGGPQARGRTSRPRGSTGERRPRGAARSRERGSRRGKGAAGGADKTALETEARPDSSAAAVEDDSVRAGEASTARGEAAAAPPEPETPNPTTESGKAEPGSGKTAAASSGDSPSEGTGPVGVELEGLEPSRLRGRTSRRGRHL